MRHHLMLGWMLVSLLGAAVVAADRAPTTAPTTRPTERIRTIKGMLAELSADRSITREAARVALMGLKRDELPLLRKAVMLQMIRAVAGEIGADRHRAQPLPDEFVDGLVRVQPAMGGFMHQDRQAQLARADDHDREQPGQRIGPDRHQRDARDDGAPGVRDQPHPAP